MQACNLLQTGSFRTGSTRAIRRHFISISYSDTNESISAFLTLVHHRLVMNQRAVPSAGPLRGPAKTPFVGENNAESALKFEMQRMKITGANFNLEICNPGTCGYAEPHQLGCTNCHDREQRFSLEFKSGADRMLMCSKQFL